MKINMPVTQNEVFLASGAFIVSKTDLKGQITYVNREFVEISGFAEADLLGQSHNIVRHPDMPPEAFADLWNTLRDGRPWVGYVKNRCKNGDFYWVEAHASPIFESGQVTGYMSVRRAPPRDVVAQCEAAYRLFRENRAKGLKIADGQVVSRGLIARYREKISQRSLSWKFMLSGAGVALLVMALSTFLLSNATHSLIAESAQAELTQKVDLVKSLVESTAIGIEKESEASATLALASFTEGFSVVQDGNDLPLLKHGATVLTRRSVEVDRLAAVIGGYVTLQARKGDDFYRVASSLKNDKGERNIGTAWGKDHPAYAPMMAGQAKLTEKVIRSGKDFISTYVPMKDGVGNVVGVLTVGIDVSKETESLKKTIRALKVGETGYLYVLDAKPGANLGKLIVHPASEGKNIYDAKDASGREFIKVILDQKKGNIFYPWINASLGETKAREKLVVFDTFDRWNWTIGGGTYVEEIELVANLLRKYLWVSALVVVVALVTAIFLLMRKLITTPLLEQVLPAFRALSSGVYSNKISVTRRDEIGKTLQGLEAMQNKLGFDVAEMQRIMMETTRIKVGLYSSTAAITISDQNGLLMHATPRAEQLLKQYSGKSLNELVDKKLTETVLTEKLQQDAMTAALVHGEDFDIQVDKYHARLSARPILDEHGKTLGRVTTWRDRTAEVDVEKEVQEIISAAAEGDFDKRLNSEDKQGFFKALALGLNQLLETASIGMKDVAKVLESLSEGDLTKKVTADYQGIFGQLKDDTNRTIDRLRDVVGNIQMATDAIDTAAKEIAAGNADLSSRTEEQASSLEETSSSMEQLNSTVKQNAENANQANLLSNESHEAVERGGAIVKDVVTMMSDIQSSSSKISDIIGVIDGIAFQTNILALNAAVEAARAGEQGRGFAVVATEVRSLAQRSAAAAKEIKGLIGESVGKVNDGVKLVEEAGNTMDEVVTSFRKVAALVSDISEASKEQSSGIEQVTLAVSQMDEVTQQNAALVEEAAAAAESLEEQAAGLVQTMRIFKTIETTSSSVRNVSISPKQTRPKHTPTGGADTWSEF
jgi:methyl-accepting chemotaxis protein